MTRQYALKYYADDKHVEMFEVKSRRTFLKKSPCPPHISLSDLYLGNEIVLHARQLKVAAYGDARTEAALSASQATSVALLSPDAAATSSIGTEQKPRTRA